MIALLAFNLTSYLAFAQTPIPFTGSWNPSPTSSVTPNNVGIGTTTPEGKLEVKYQPCATPQNGLVVTQAGCSAGQMVGNAGNNNGGVIQIDLNGGGVVLPPSVNYIPWAFPFSTLTLPLVNNSSKPLMWARTENQDMNFNLTGYKTEFIVLPNGKTGINTASPRCMLDVLYNAGSANNNPTAVFSSIKSGGTLSIPHPETNVPTSVSGKITRSLMFFNNLKENGYNRIVNENDQALIFTDGAGMNGTEVSGANVAGSLVIAPYDNNVNSPTSTVGGIRIDNLGNVEVHGTLRATDMTVNAKWWSDFVFAKNYNLMPLTDVSLYIKTNGHLPGMPSEKMVLDSGLNISDMQALQQQKIEELTLYSIAQDEKLKAQAEAIAAQEAKLKALEAKLEALTK